jgi:hypothetical protein
VKGTAFFRRAGLLALAVLFMTCDYAGSAAAQDTSACPSPGFTRDPQTGHCYDSQGRCGTDQDCNDYVFCNGAERCMPGAPGEDAHGCIAPSSPPCLVGQTCSESAQRCVSPSGSDDDHDGHRALIGGGDDCDDHDANNFPGNYEVWDSADHDEDCNPRTHGTPPGFGRTGRIGPVSVCSGEQVIVLDGIVGGEESFTEHECNYGGVCVPQPSGDGTCQPRPEGYAAPPLRSDIPLRDQQPVDHSRPRFAVPAAIGRIPATTSGTQFAKPMIKLMPAIQTTACAPGLVRDAKSGTCVKLACPPGTYFDDKKGSCVVK